MSYNFQLSLSPFVRFVENKRGRYAFQVKKITLPLVEPGPGLLAAMKRLAGEGARETWLFRAVSGDGFIEQLKLRYYLDELINQGWLCHSVIEGRLRLATCVPISRDHRFEGDPVQPASRFLLSRFACCRREGNRWVLESPLSRAQLILYKPAAAALVAELASARSASDLSRSVPLRTAIAFLQLLRNAGFLTNALADGRAEEEAQPNLAQWEFHDLFFHSRSREGRHANPYGGTDRFRGKAQRAPMVKPPMSDDVLELPRPDLKRLRRKDRPFTEILESRHSERKHGPAVITLAQLGEFLFRAAAIREVLPVKDTHVSRRVYPCGGAAYEQELYLAVNQCQGLSSGLYHYRPLEHQLCRLSHRTLEVDWLLENASYMASTDPPQLLIIIAARFQRVSWRYSSMAYAAILKNTGALFQTMYLVATAMGLAPCALGGGHSDMFTRAAGTDYYEETSVGEFMLGARTA